MSEVEVETLYLGRRARFGMHRDGTTVLAAARAAQLELPSMCEAGSCATCRARLRAGEVSMLANLVLGADELAAGYVLACQAVPLSARLTLDFDAA